MSKQGYYPYYMIHVSGQPDPTHKHFSEDAYRDELMKRVAEHPATDIFVIEHPGILWHTDYSTTPPTNGIVDANAPRNIEWWTADGHIVRGDDLESL